MLLLVLLLLIVLLAAEETAEKSTFLGLGLLLIAILGALDARTSWLRWLAGRQDSRSVAGRQGLLGAAEAKKLLEEVAPVVVGVGAGVVRRGALQEGSVVVL